jgi:hypothetical protein
MKATKYQSQPTDSKAAHTDRDRDRPGQSETVSAEDRETPPYIRVSPVPTFSEVMKRIATGDPWRNGAYATERSALNGGNVPCHEFSRAERALAYILSTKPKIEVNH